MLLRTYQEYAGPRRRRRLAMFAAGALVIAGATTVLGARPAGAVGQCEAGTYSATGLEPCTPAPPGTFVSITGATTPTPCPAGTFTPTAGNTSCTPAPIGSYVPVSGATAPTLCLPGTYSGASGLTACTPAPPGTFVSITGATTPTPCPAGTFTPTAGNTSCTPAPIGSYVPNIGATSATLCPVGTTTTAQGSTGCVPTTPNPKPKVTVRIDQICTTVNNTYSWKITNTGNVTIVAIWRVRMATPPQTGTITLAPGQTSTPFTTMNSSNKTTIEVLVNGQVIDDQDAERPSECRSSEHTDDHASSDHSDH